MERLVNCVYCGKQYDLIKNVNTCPKCGNRYVEESFFEVEKQLVEDSSKVTSFKETDDHEKIPNESLNSFIKTATFTFYAIILIVLAIIIVSIFVL